MAETARAPMMRRFGGMKGYAITTTEGDVGTFDDFLFDETSWTVRQLVVDTGSWLSGRRVLLSPRSIAGIEDTGRRMMTDVTRRQLEASPDVDATQPVSRQHEIALAAYYGYPFYWTGPYRWGTSPAPMPLGMETARAAGTASDVRPPGVEPELHRATDVIGYGIAAADGELGHVEDYLVDEESWAIRYLIVDPRNWWPNAHVLIGVEWFTDVSWDGRTVGVDMTRDAVRNAPEWRPEQPVERDWETRLHRHHERPGYWERPADRYLVWPYAA